MYPTLLIQYAAMSMQMSHCRAQRNHGLFCYWNYVKWMFPTDVCGNYGGIIKPNFNILSFPCSSILFNLWRDLFNQCHCYVYFFLEWGKNETIESHHSIFQWETLVNTTFILICSSIAFWNVCCEMIVQDTRCTTIKNAFYIVYISTLFFYLIFLLVIWLINVSI